MQNRTRFRLGAPTGTATDDVAHLRVSVGGLGLGLVELQSSLVEIGGLGDLALGEEHVRLLLSIRRRARRGGDRVCLRLRPRCRVLVALRLHLEPLLLCGDHVGGL